MKSLKKCLLNRKYRLTESLKEKELLKYLNRKLRKKWTDKNGERRENKRPVELKYLWIAKATGMTYKQVRIRMDKLVASGILEKYRAWDRLNHRRNYYRYKTLIN